jgi:hypothetical protein
MGNHPPHDHNRNGNRANDWESIETNANSPHTQQSANTNMEPTLSLDAVAPDAALQDVVGSSPPSPAPPSMSREAKIDEVMSFMQFSIKPSTSFEGSILFKFKDTEDETKEHVTYLVTVSEKKGAFLFLCLRWQQQWLTTADAVYMQTWRPRRTPRPTTLAARSRAK